MNRLLHDKLLNMIPSEYWGKNGTKKYLEELGSIKVIVRLYFEVGSSRIAEPWADQDLTIPFTLKKKTKCSFKWFRLI